MNLWRRSLIFFQPDLPRLIGVFTLLLGSIAANLLKPWPVAIIVDSFLGNNPLPAWMPAALTSPEAKSGGIFSPTLLALVASVFVLHLVHGCLSMTHNYLSIGTGLRGLRRVRNAVFACLQRLSLRFHQGHKTGDLIYRAAWDTYSFQTLFQQGFMSAAIAVLSLILMLGVMWRMNGKLTLVALVTVPLMLLAIRFFGRKMHEHGIAAQQADSAVTSLVQQSLITLPLVQSYTREDKEQEIFVAQTAVAQERRMAQHGWELIYWLGVTLAFGVGLTLTLWAGTSQVLAGALTIGQLWIFLAYLAQLYEPLNQLSNVGAIVATASAAARRVFELLDVPEEVKDLPDARPVMWAGMAPEANHPASKPLLVRGEVAFENVSFAYETDRLILREISFQIRPGESLAIIGPSGAGKTTLMNLIPRFFDPASGVVKLDGEDLRQLKTRDLRAQIAVVLQEPILLPSTIADNIAYGKPGARLAEIKAAARAANAHEFIEKMPHQYQTRIGDGGARLSAGERQRINIARAFLKDAPILLLDEPTSALDAENEAAVVESLLALMQNRTTIMIAHRLTTIQRVNRVLVLQDGRLMEIGSPAELRRKSGGYFARVAAGQMSLG